MKQYLRQFSKQELEAELNRREVEAKRIAYESALTLAGKYNKNIDSLLELIEHGRTSCQDNNHINGWYSSELRRLPPCNRCFILNSPNWWDERLKLEINLVWNEDGFK